jgi:signal peptidase II
VYPEPHSRRSARSIVFMLVSLLLLTALDLGSKEWALQNLAAARSPDARPPVCEPDTQGRISYQRKPEPPRPLIDGVLNLYYAENCGAAFSFLRTAPGWLRLSVFGAASLGATIVLIWMFVRGSGGRMFAAAVPLIASGAIGNNLSDRPRHGFVVDFLQVHPDLFNYPIFNVADIWITIGIALMLIEGFRKTPEQLADSSTPLATSGSVKS